MNPDQSGFLNCITYKAKTARSQKSCRYIYSPINSQIHRSAYIIIYNIICFQLIILGLDINFYALDLLAGSAAISVFADLCNFGQRIVLVTALEHNLVGFLLLC